MCKYTEGDGICLGFAIVCLLKPKQSQGNATTSKTTIPRTFPAKYSKTSPLFVPDGLALQQTALYCFQKTQSFCQQNYLEVSGWVRQTWSLHQLEQLVPQDAPIFAQSLLRAEMSPGALGISEALKRTPAQVSRHFLVVWVLIFCYLLTRRLRHAYTKRNSPTKTPTRDRADYIPAYAAYATTRSSTRFLHSATERFVEIVLGREHGGRSRTRRAGSRLR